MAEFIQEKERAMHEQKAKPTKIVVADERFGIITWALPADVCQHLEQATPKTRLVMEDMLRTSLGGFAAMSMNELIRRQDQSVLTWFWDVLGKFNYYFTNPPEIPTKSDLELSEDLRWTRTSRKI